uniref:Secreted protein n=1 Tax=Plectus sambesii TaxID=2011161 RepID=A0A914UL41_9BILA
MCFHSGSVSAACAHFSPLTPLLIMGVRCFAACVRWLLTLVTTSSARVATKVYADSITALRSTADFGRRRGQRTKTATMTNDEGRICCRRANDRSNSGKLLATVTCGRLRSVVLAERNKRERRSCVLVAIGYCLGGIRRLAAAFAWLTDRPVAGGRLSVLSCVSPVSHGRAAPRRIGFRVSSRKAAIVAGKSESRLQMLAEADRSEAYVIGQAVQYGRRRDCVAAATGSGRSFAAIAA